MDRATLLTKLVGATDPDLTDDEITVLLQGDDPQLTAALYHGAQTIRAKYVGNRTFFRGLVEMSNICAKNCLYCGIRRDNPQITRYQMSEEEILDACRFAMEQGYGSVVLQSGELSSIPFIEAITALLLKINSRFAGKLRVTLSCGEQSAETYARWFAAGAQRYLLRVETSNPHLYEQLHPNDGHHVFAERVACLHSLRQVGYQVGSGVMLGLPGQSFGDIARDLRFLQEIDVDMVGMGPYLEHEQTPLFSARASLWPLQQRLAVSLRAVAVLRVLMKDINIAASTALQAIDPQGREKALEVGANVIMPNLTPTAHRKDYALYANKPCVDEDRQMCSSCLEGRVRSLGQQIERDQWGDSKHYLGRHKPD